MDTEKLWLWLSLIRGIGKKKTEELIKVFQNPKGIWNASKEELSRVTLINKNDAQRIYESKDIDKIDKYIRGLEEKKIKFFSIEHENYPTLLKNIYDPPNMIYVKGRLPKDYNKYIAIVGSRQCTEYGINISKKLSKELVENDFTVVSGMARGIDTNAHNGALEGRGKTVAVLGCGVDVCYPKENLRLMNEIEYNGAIISEFPVGTQPKPGLFPMRNRIISGLCQGVIVIEAKKRSGSLITADQALEQNRNVYAVPGSITSKFSQGTNNLIKQGAKMVTNIEDILEDYDIRENEKRTPIQIRINDLLDQKEEVVYNELSSEPKHIDEIYRNLNISVNELQHHLTMLEIKGVISQLPNKRFVVKMLY